MVQQSTTSWRKGELYDTLCLLLTAECVWIAGQGLGLFTVAGDVVARYGLSNLVMFGFCMSFGVLAASVHKSLKLGARCGHASGPRRTRTSSPATTV